MKLFLSTYRNRIDKKGRVSVPAAFRNIVTNQEFQGIVAYSSLMNGCIEACGVERITKMHAHMETLDPFSEERDAFATTLFGESVQLGFDSEGRVMLPQHLLEEADISNEAIFVGKGEIFEIWQPERFEEYAVRAREIALTKRHQLRAQPPKGGNA